MRRVAVGLVSCSVLAAAVGCGGSTDSVGDPGAQGGPAPATVSLETGIGPVALTPGEETTVCLVLDLGNAEPMVVTSIAGDLAPGSHHLILYRSSATSPSDAPKKCNPFSGILNGEAPLMIIQKPHDELVFPSGVGLEIAAHQMVKIEAHYIDTGKTALEGSGKLEIKGIPGAAGDSIVRSDLAFWGTTGIHIPPNAQWTTGAKFQSAVDGMHGFALTTHQHHLGTRFRVWYSPEGSDTSSTPIADTTSWSDPPLYRFETPLAFDPSGGLNYQCDYQNTTSSQVGFGESALEEMCFLWMYYYPSHGFDICFDGLCLDR